jgi:hypothetical protein
MFRHNIAGITFRTSRLRSSLSSLYQNYDFHLRYCENHRSFSPSFINECYLTITNNFIHPLKGLREAQKSTIRHNGILLSPWQEKEILIL